MTVGLTTIEKPFPFAVPPHDPVYQYQFAPVPRVPPVMSMFVDEPSVITGWVADVIALVISETVFRVIVT